jgi:hypothetical protein
MLRATQEFASATRQVHQAIPGRPGFGIEAKYGQTYQWLVRLGAAPQINQVPGVEVQKACPSAECQTSGFE